MAGVSTATGFAANVSSSVLSGLWNKVVRVVKMIISVPQDVTDMAEQAERLNNVIHGINEKLAQEQKPPQRIVKAWLDKAGEAIESSGSIRSDYWEHKNCLSCCPNCLCRYKISKRIRDWKGNVAQLHSQRQSDFPPTGEYGDPTPRTQVPIHENPESSSAANTRRSAQTKLVERWLTDEDSNVRRIGLNGMGGVGKTSLLDTINNSQKVKNSFELIIKVTVSKNHILDMQECVASRLNILTQFREKSNFEERKDMLCRSLVNKKLLLLLDDMWAEDMWTSDKLQDLGVSLDDAGFKIVLTTRDKQVCRRMNVQETITVEPLLEEEGWQLFRSRAFQSRNGDVPPEIEEVARKVAKECKGLPLAIIVVAAAMTHHTDLNEWGVALDQMQNVPETFDDLHPGVYKELYQPLKWSYDVLRSHLQTCFRYFAAYPEDRVISCQQVIDIWIAEGVVEGSRESYLPDTAHSFINFLRDRCLIEVVEYDSVGRISSVKIHDVLRDLAIRIAEKEHSCIFKAGSLFPVEEVDVKGCTRLSLMSNDLRSLPTTFACSSLSVLLLRENHGIQEVPGSFLHELSSLKVLDLSDTGITSLPASIGNLKHLASLQLEKTGICELPESICDLKELQFLNLTRCVQLRCLPERISELKRLRALEISYCRTLSHLPRGISELVSLERLNMSGSGISLHFEGDANAERMYACFKDLQSLRRLRVLYVKLTSAVKEGVIGNWSKMRDLSLVFDDDVNQDELPQDMQAMKDLERFSLEGCDVERLPSWLTQFRKLADLNISGCQQLKELPAELPCLRELWMHKCGKLEKLKLGMGFPKLEQLTLILLDSLECVGAGEGAAASGSGSGSGGLGEGASPLPMLKSLHVWHCPQLKRLRGGWDKLKCLESIKSIDGNREWWDAMECDDPSIKTSLQSKLRFSM